MIEILDEATKQKLRAALRFSASRSVLSSEDERRILSALSTHSEGKDEEGVERAATLEEAAKLAEDFGWTLPIFTDAATNEATDYAACAVQSQIAAAIRSLIPKKKEG